ncbi:MAG: glycerol-3-phosphate dehydrogenase [Alteraurantiacibacter sp.]
MKADTVFDLVVVGGGVNGAGVARDAAGRGAKVLLLEQGDLASGTSSKSTKLVHGGLRYLEYYEFALVREALGEREILWDIAPHIVWPLRFVLPVTKQMRPRWMLRAGLALYDMIGGRGAFPRARSIALASHAAGAPLESACRRAFEYSDGWVDDARLVVLNALDAAERGATIMPRMPVTRARREGELWAVETPKGKFLARALVNAAGPAADDVAGLTGEAPTYTLRRVRGSHIVVPKLFDHPYAYLLQQPDTRICFAIPYEQDFTLIGTTDADHSGDPFAAEASEAEIRYLCDAANRYFVRDIVPGDVLHTYSGVRALVDDGSGRPEAATRGYKVVLSDADEGAPLLGIYGGKITSYRHIAEDAVDRLAPRLDALSGLAWTARSPLPGGDFGRGSQHHLVALLTGDYPFLSGRDALRIARAYGTRAVDWLGDARDWSDLGRNFGAGLSEAELVYMRDTEWAAGAEDALWRRSKLGLRLNADQYTAVAAYFGG